MRDRSCSASALQRVLLFGTFGVLFSSLSVAAAEKRRFDIAAGQASSTLNEFSRQAELQIYFDADAARRFMTNAVAGEFEAADALSKMLGGTGLAFEFVNQRTVAILLKGTQHRPGHTNAASSGDLIAAAGYGVTSLRGNDPEANQPPIHATERGGMESAGDEEIVVRGLPEVFVRGSRILNIDLPRSRDDAQPYIVFDHETIATSGAVSVEDFLKQRLPMNTARATSSQGSPELGNISQINLRGLGTNQTLILIDGRRAAATAFSGFPLQPTLSGVPLAAVERIEVLPTTASGIYGGGATGGVINVVLRRDYQGVETRLTYGNTFEGDVAGRQVDMSAGFSLEGGRTSILLAGSYSDADELLTRDRQFLGDGRATVIANNPSFFLNATNPPLGMTPNIRSATGANLVLRNGTPLNSPVTHVPAGYSGTASDGGAALVANAGRLNLEPATNTQLGGRASGLLSSPTSKSLAATVRREFAPWLQLFAEFAGANNESENSRTNSALTNTFTLPASAPNNPFTQAIRVTVPTGGDRKVAAETTDRRAVTGVIVQLPKAWQAELDYTWQRSRTSFWGTHSLSAAGTSAITSGQLDIVRDIEQFPIDVSPFLQAPSRVEPLSSTLTESALRIAGTVATLPAGGLTVSAFLGHRDEEFGTGTQFVNPTLTILFPEKSQYVDSVYLEGHIPLFSDRNRIAAIEELNLQLAGRWDEYTINGVTGNVFNPSPTSLIAHARNRVSSVDPTVGLRWKPIRDLMFRGSLGTGFLPPSLTQLVPNPVVTTSNIVDPRRGGTLSPAFQLLTGGNPDLEPEESRSWSGGIVMTPGFAPSLRLSVDYTRIEKTNNIANFFLQQLVDNESFFPNRIVRGPSIPGDPPGWPGPIIAVDQTAVNISRAWVEAYDVQLDYQLGIDGVGTFDFFGVGTWTSRYDTQLIPSAPVTDNVGTAAVSSFSFPLELRGNLGLTWKNQNWMVGWLMSYFDSYTLTNPTQVLNQGDGGRIPSQTYHDLVAGYRFNLTDGGSDLLSGLDLKLGIRNVFNKKPPFDASDTTNFYSNLGDPRLANYYFTVTKQF